MKRLPDGLKTLTGQITNNTYDGSENRIQLFDGLFTTGYKILSFKVTPNVPSAAQEITAKLSTEPKSTVTEWDWSDVEEVAWAYWASDQATLTSDYLNIRDDTMVIQDLWVSGGGADGTINYEIVLEKYSFADYEGAINMIRNKSQAVT
tara:strand:- start:48 stop:494 length:447 start_codon:yes stop_codon:yes gene_type:complete